MTNTLAGFDVAADTRPHLTAIAAAGYRWIGRYLATHTQIPGKILTPDEARAISAAGLQIVSVWENGSPTSAAYFSHSQGDVDGAAAAQLATALGQPTGTPIYFAVDYDALGVEVAGRITNYFAEVQSLVRAAGYEAGVYGSGLTCRTLVANGWATRAWLAGATGWSYYNTLSTWQIKQGTQRVICGLTADPDTAQGDFGGWSVGTLV